MSSSNLKKNHITVIKIATALSHAFSATPYRTLHLLMLNKLKQIMVKMETKNVG